MKKRLPLLTKLLTHGEQCRLIGARAEALRKLKKLSRKELSELSGVSTATIARFELKGTATLSVILKLAYALDTLDSFSKVFLLESYESLEEFEQA